MLFVVAYEPPPDDRTLAARRLRLAAQAARESDLHVVPLPWPFSHPNDVLPDRLPGDLAVYSGPIPQHFEHYARLEAALEVRGAGLLNSAEASRQASRIDEWGPLLGTLTASTVVLHSPRDLGAAAALGFPLFVRGAVKSAKGRGLPACLAEDVAALEWRAHSAWRRRQMLVARELLPLRQTGRVICGFPQGREYRFLLLDREIITGAFYWDGVDPFGAAQGDDHLRWLASEAAGCLDARAVAVDLGQLDDGSWRVIEVGDAQHTALAHINPHQYWALLRERLG